MVPICLDRRGIRHILIIPWYIVLVDFFIRGATQNERYCGVGWSVVQVAYQYRYRFEEENERLNIFRYALIIRVDHSDGVKRNELLEDPIMCMKALGRLLGGSPRVGFVGLQPNKASSHMQESGKSEPAHHLLHWLKICHPCWRKRGHLCKNEQKVFYSTLLVHGDVS